MTGNSDCTQHVFCIAEHIIKLSFAAEQKNGLHLVQSLIPFIAKDTEKHIAPLFELVVDDATKPINKESRTRIREVDTGNGITIVDRLNDGGYQFIIRDINGNGCCLLIANEDFSHCRCALNGTTTMRTFGLNNALMLAYAFAGSSYDTVLIHASLIRNAEWAYAFTAKSGTGKSTHVSLWMQHIPECDIMNDDNPIIRIIDGETYIYGSPWSGKTPCYRNVKARLGAMTKINRSDQNYVKAATTIEALTTLLSACSTMKWDHRVFNNISSIISKIIETTPNYNLYCRPDKEAAIVCYKAISRNQPCK